MAFENLRWVYEKEISWVEALERDGQILSCDDFCPQLYVRAYTFSEESVSIGRLFRLNEMDLPALRERDLPIWKRYTGGQLALHGSDLCFSVHTSTFFLVSHPVQIQKIFTDSLMSCLKNRGVDSLEKGRIAPVVENIFCFQRGSVYDIFYRGHKLVGWGGRIRKRRAFFQFQCGALAWGGDLIRERFGFSVDVPQSYIDIVELVKREDFIEDLMEDLSERMKPFLSMGVISESGAGL